MTPRRVALAVLVWAVASLVPVPGSVFSAKLAAHDIGKTVVTATFAERRYQIDILVDADALVAKLEVYAGGMPSDRSPAERDRRISELQTTFLSRTAVKFDGRLVKPSFAYLPADEARAAGAVPVPDGAGIVRLSGPLPDFARTFTLTYALVLGSYALNVHVGHGPILTTWVEAGQESAPAALTLTGAAGAPTRLMIARQYVALGFTHILPRGTDHILFVVGLFLLSARWKPLLLQISAFTIAHSITLGLTIYGIVSLPARVVEPMIALSIAYVAIENVATKELKPWRVALVFCFGLLHGMGFAGVLRELGLPRSEFLTALVTFNLGVEGGQLTVIAMAFFALGQWKRNGDQHRRWIAVPASIAIAVTGLYWTYSRILA